jgi:2-alkenal reductase
VSLANFEVLGGAVANVEPLGSGLVWDQRGYVVTAYASIVTRGGAMASASAGASSSASGVPAAPEQPLAAGGTAAGSSAAASSGGRRIRVALLDASVSPPLLKEYPAELVGASPLHNLAVLLLTDVPPEILAPIALGTSADLRVGQAAFALGLPFGQSHSLSYGVISGLRRPLASAQAGLFVPGGAVQTDASIDASNTGGALMDSAGRLVGMCVAPATLQRGTAATAQRAASLSFAVPVDVLTRIVPQLIAYGEPRG